MQNNKLKIIVDQVPTKKVLLSSEIDLKCVAKHEYAATTCRGFAE